MVNTGEVTNIRFIYQIFRSYKITLFQIIADYKYLTHNSNLCVILTQGTC